MEEEDLRKYIQERVKVGRGVSAGFSIENANRLGVLRRGSGRSIGFVQSGSRSSVENRSSLPSTARPSVTHRPVGHGQSDALPFRLLVESDQFRPAESKIVPRRFVGAETRLSFRFTTNTRPLISTTIFGICCAVRVAKRRRSFSYWTNPM